MNSSRIAPPDRGSAVRKGATAILDQFLFVGASSLLVLLLGRGLDADQYGAFVLAYTLFQLLGQAQTAVIAEPMSVFGPSRFAARENDYILAVHSLNLRSALLAAAVMLALAALSAAIGKPPLAAAFLGAGVAAPLLLSLWLRRRALYLQGRIRRSVVASSLYLVISVGGVYGLLRLGLLNALTGMIALAAGSGLALMASPLTPAEPGERSSNVLRLHWEYGRWALLTALLGWCGNLYYFLLPIRHGLESTAALRAVMNFVYPIIQVNQALAFFLLPRWSAHGSRVGFTRSLLEVTGAWSLFSLALFGGSVLFGPAVMHWVYKGQYDAFAFLLPWAVLLTLPDGVSYVIGSGLRAGRMPHRVAAAALALPIVLVFPGALFVFLWGPAGAVAALLIASAGQLGLSWYGWRRRDEAVIPAA